MDDGTDKEQKEIKEVPVVTDRSSMPKAPQNTADIRKTSGIRLGFLSAVFLLLVSSAAGFGGGWLAARDSDKQSMQKQQVVLKSQGELISSIANDVGASVVSIEVVTQSRSMGGFFGFQGTTEKKGAGTGFILDKNGLIITNRHVVPAGTKSVSITLSDGTIFEDVSVVGRTSESDPLDVAFLKIKDVGDKRLAPVRLGDSSSVKIGESVIAIGNALGQFQNTVTSGIISGHGRSVVAGDSNGDNPESLQNLFQTDAAINQGNSGGPLVNLNGEVIGINTAVAGDAQNIGFSIPINDVKGVIQNVITKGKLERPYLGVVYIPVTADLVERYSLGKDKGAYIPSSIEAGQATIIAGSPAEKAGLKERDIILKVNNDTVDEKNSLTSLLGKHAAGDKVQVSVFRDGKEQVIEVTLGIAPES